ncbi:hypothetical protein [Nocardia fluminea]|uniref:hypothetical protein n=1 Tax=Nocardia fluminea TaxID=134984 RepID=UPI0034453574
MMSKSVSVEANNLRPSRINAVGWCLYCVTRNCTSARCIATHARTEWQVCGKCGGSEYVDGHIDPDTAFRRCDCFGGVIEVDAFAEVIELNPVDEDAELAARVCARCDHFHLDGLAADHAFVAPKRVCRVITTGNATGAAPGMANVPGWGI